MNDKELEALSRVLNYLDACVEETPSPEMATRYDSITLRDWLNYQIDMATLSGCSMCPECDCNISNDAKRAAANAYAKERS